MGVDEVDFIPEIADDEETALLILILNSVENGQKFMDIVPLATRKKPIVILKSGTPYDGKVAASSHTGALPGDDVAFKLAFERARVIHEHFRPSTACTAIKHEI
jgi:acetyltransferase